MDLCPPVGVLLLSFQDLPPDRYARIATVCRQHGLGVRRMRFVLEDVEPHRREGTR